MTRLSLGLTVLLLGVACADHPGGHDAGGHHRPEDKGPFSEYDPYTGRPPGYINGPTEDPSDLVRPRPPERPPQEFDKYGEYYCPHNDDDCGWKPDRENNFCWKTFPHSKVSFADAYYDCQSRSIKGCPARLLMAYNVPAVYYSMTYEDLEVCPPDLRIDGKFNKDAGVWETYEDYMVRFPGSHWSNDSYYEPWEPNRHDGSLTVNFGEKYVSGILDGMVDTIGMVCEACVIEIPECPRICDKCIREPEIIPEPEVTEPPSERCENIQGSVVISFLGGLNRYTEELSKNWLIYDERHNVCDAPEQFAGGQFKGEMAAFFELESPRAFFGIASYATTHSDGNGSGSRVRPLEYKVIAGGVMDWENGDRYVTDSVAIAHSYVSPHAVTDGPKDVAMHYERMSMPRAHFGMSALYASYPDLKATEHFVAYGGKVDMAGTLTDTIEVRKLDLTEDYIFGLDFQQEYETDGWQISEFTLSAPSRTLVAHFGAILDKNHEFYYEHYGTTQVVALIDTRPVQFDMFYLDGIVTRDFAKVEDYSLPPLMLPEGAKLAGFVGFIYGNYLMAIDDTSRDCYILDPGDYFLNSSDYSLNQPDEITPGALDWVTLSTVLPEGLTHRHLTVYGEDFSEQFADFPTLVAYDENELQNRVFFFNWRTNTWVEDIFFLPWEPHPIFGPILLNMPPMDGAAVGTMVLPPHHKFITAINAQIDQWPYRSAGMSLDMKTMYKLKSRALKQSLEKYDEEIALKDRIVLEQIHSA